MTIKITAANGGSDSLDFGCAQTAIVATVTGTEVSSGEGKLELKTTTGGTSATKATILANGNVGIGTTTPTNGKLEVTHSSATVPAGHFRNTSGSGDSPALIVQGGANNTGGNFQVKDYAGNVDFQVGGDGAVTLGTPLPVASGGTGATSGVQIVRQHYIPSTGGIVTAAGNSTWQSISTSATISVTAGNILTIWWVAGVYARSSMHWAGTVFLNGTNVQSGNWGNGINEGAGTVTGWHTTTGIARKVIPATGNHVLELKLKANAGNIDINRDGNLGYDGAYMIVQETTP